MTAFATLPEVQDRLDWELDLNETRVVNAALEDASDLARQYGREWIDATTAPRLVRTLVLRAVVRYMKNPEGYIQSRAGDETVVWSDDHKGFTRSTVYYEEDEKKLLAELAGRTPGLSGADITAFGPGHRFRRTSDNRRYNTYERRYSRELCEAPQTGLVPVDDLAGVGRAVPLYEDDDSPWVDGS